jgi:hypothetical protein
VGAALGSRNLKGGGGGSAQSQARPQLRMAIPRPAVPPAGLLLSTQPVAVRGRDRHRLVHPNAPHPKTWQWLDGVKGRRFHPS